MTGELFEKALPLPLFPTNIKFLSKLQDFIASKIKYRKTIPKSDITLTACWNFQFQVSKTISSPQTKSSLWILSDLQINTTQLLFLNHSNVHLQAQSSFSCHKIQIPFLGSQKFRNYRAYPYNNYNLYLQIPLLTLSYQFHIQLFSVFHPIKGKTSLFFKEKIEPAWKLNSQPMKCLKNMILIVLLKRNKVAMSDRP